MKRLYYISQGKTPEEHVKNIENACKNGVRLFQLRMKGISREQFLETAIMAKAVSNECNTTLIINDDIVVANAIGAGVHLGKNDESIAKARSILKNAIIGGTANTLQDCITLIEQGVDYIGLGPFRFTETKKELSPILGLEGYENIIKSLRERGYKTPIYAIGGIQKQDIDDLLDVGVHGIAVSELLTDKSSYHIKEIVKKLTPSEVDRPCK